MVVESGIGSFGGGGRGDGLIVLNTKYLVLKDVDVLLS